MSSQGEILFLFKRRRRAFDSAAALDDARRLQRLLSALRQWRAHLPTLAPSAFEDHYSNGMREAERQVGRLIHLSAQQRRASFEGVCPYPCKCGAPESAVHLCTHDACRVRWVCSSCGEVVYAEGGF